MDIQKIKLAIDEFSKKKKSRYQFVRKTESFPVGFADFLREVPANIDK